MQAMGRACRQGSHEELPQEERDITYYIHVAILLDQLPEEFWLSANGSQPSLAVFAQGMSDVW